MRATLSVGNSIASGRDSVLLDLARNQIALGDVDLLLLGVAGELDDLHAVEQRRRYRVQLVGCADKQHVAEVERLIEVVVAERVVLLRVQRLEQRARRVAAEVAPELVDLVQHEDGVTHLDPLQMLDDLTRQSSDISAAVAADLRLVMHAAERDARELATEGPGDGAAERGFSHARRADEAEDRALHVGLQTAHAQVIEDAVLHLLEAVMVGVEDLLRLLDVDLAGGVLGPRQNGEPLDVVAREGVVRRGGIHAAEAAELLERVLLDLLRHAGRFDLFFELLDVLLGLVGVAELLLDGLHLLAEVVVTLRLLDGVLHLALNLVAKLLDLDLLGEMAVQLFEPRLDVGSLEQFLPLGRCEERQAGGDEVGEPRRFLDIDGDGLQVVRQGRRRGDDLAELADDIALQGLELGRIRRDDLMNGFELGREERLHLRKIRQFDALGALGEDEEALVGHLDDLMDGRPGADGMQVGSEGGVLAGVALGDHQDRLLLAEGLDELDGALTAHGQGQNGVGEQNRISNRENRIRSSRRLFPSPSLSPVGRITLTNSFGIFSVSLSTFMHRMH